jgi:hypothetical protein
VSLWFNKESWQIPPKVSDAWQAEREWLRSFFAALAGKNRDAMLKGLQAVREEE